VLEAPFLMPLSTAFMLIAFVAWATTMIGLGDSVLRSFRRPTKLPATG
jgi:alkanesulfonate monooxygenase SsuD/methylene tetrahydromethanopterin reductase-like flavin-dependent oxidoreductase (luciferase family)